MDDLVQFLRARYDEEATEAVEIADQFGGTWTADDNMGSIGSDTGADVIDDAAAPQDFIARYDPARAAAEVAAKREILALHRPVQRRSTGSAGGTISDCQMCGHFPAQYPCGTLRLLSLPYADHPDYRAEWRP